LRGVVYGLEDTEIRSAVSGFVSNVAILPGREVKRGQVLCTLANEESLQRVKQLSAEIELLELKAILHVDEPNVASAFRIEAEHVRCQLEQANQQRKDLRISTPLDGVLLDYRPDCDIGQFVSAGQPIASVASRRWQVRAYASDGTLSTWTPQIGQPLDVRLLGDPTDAIRGVITRVALRGTNEIKDANVTQLGGGNIPVAPDTMTTNDAYFEVTIDLQPSEQTRVRQGMSAVVQFPGESTRLGLLGYRQVLRFLNDL
ncbi:MAG: HlyD family efflux transporter periplasmic adaptor subunit, partial [Planctomycetota bacterium]